MTGHFRKGRVHELGDDIVTTQPCVEGWLRLSCDPRKRDRRQMGYELHKRSPFVTGRVSGPDIVKIGVARLRHNYLRGSRQPVSALLYCREAGGLEPWLRVRRRGARRRELAV